MSFKRSQSLRGVVAGAWALGAALLTGCQQPAGEVFPALEQPIVWPGPPEQPRIRYVGQLEQNTDLKPARSFGETVGETLFGKGDSLSMLTPQAVCTDEQNRLFVADSSGQMVHVFNFESREYQRWKPEEEGVTLAQPVAVAFDPRGRLLVSDAVSGAIHVFDSDGQWLGTMGEAFLKRPCGLAIDRTNDRLFVADSAAHQIVVLSFDGALLDRLGRRGTGPGEFNFPTNVAVGPEGRLYVSDSLNFRVQVFDPSLEPLFQIGSKGDMPGYFSQPKGIALDSEQHVYVVDAHFEAVQIFDAQGRLLLSFGEEGTAPGRFWLPNGIYIDANDRIWIADSYNRRVQVFDYLPEPSP